METGWLKTYLDFKKNGFNGARNQHTNIEKTEQDTPAPRPQEADLPRLRGLPGPGRQQPHPHPPALGAPRRQHLPHLRTRHTDTVREEGNNFILTTK